MVRAVDARAGEELESDWRSVLGAPDHSRPTDEAANRVIRKEHHLWFEVAIAARLGPGSRDPPWTGLWYRTHRAGCASVLAAVAHPTAPGATLALVESARLRAHEVLSRLSTSPGGLSQAEAGRRLSAVGPNAIRTHDVRTVAILGRQLRNPLLILLGAATVIALAVGERTDAFIILSIVPLSVGLGFFNEFRSERVIEALHSSIRHQTLVLRDGAPGAVDVTSLVPGDVVELSTGDLVPADLRLIGVRELECDQAVLTGEAMPKTKSAEPERDPQAGELGLACIGLVELGKIFFYAAARQRKPTLPVERWEHSPQLQSAERFASRWSIHPRSNAAKAR